MDTTKSSVGNPWGKTAVSWNSKNYIISGAQLATISAAYYAMCVAEDDGDVGSHYQLVNAFNAAGITGLDKANARKLGAELC